VGSSYCTSSAAIISKVKIPSDVVTLKLAVLQHLEKRFQDGAGVGEHHAAATATIARLAQVDDRACAGHRRSYHSITFAGRAFLEEVFGSDFHELFLGMMRCDCRAIGILAIEVDPTERDRLRLLLE
jgi:hypothetical protein